MIEKLVEIISVIGLSAFRHTFGGVPLASGLGFNYLEVAILTALGGTIGLIFFIHLSHLLKWIFKTLIPVNSRANNQKRIFTKRNRFVVRIKQKWGLLGIAFLTPPLLSIPIGTTIAASLYKDKRQVFVTLLSAVLFWSFVGGFMAFLPLENLLAILHP